MKEEIERFISWMFLENNKDFVKNSSDRKIAQVYNSETNSKVSNTFVSYHRFRWILVDHKPYDITRIPDFILKYDSFKKYAEDNNIAVETLDWSINSKPVNSGIDPIVENI